MSTNANRYLALNFSLSNLAHPNKLLVPEIITILMIWCFVLELFSGFCLQLVKLESNIFTDMVRFEHE